MSSLVIFLTTAVITIIVSKHEVTGINVQDVDVDKLLNIIQKQRANHASGSNSESSSSSESDTSDDGSYTRAGRAEEDNIVDVLKQLANNKNNKVNSNRKNRKEKSYNVVRAQNDIGNNQRNEEIAYILGHVLNNGKVEPIYETRTKTQKKRLTPNRLLWDVNNRGANDLDDYSKIYIMLTPKAVQKTKSRSTINQLISKILSLSAPPANRNHPGPQRQKRYKGFAINDPAGRRRGSREIYAPNDSLEDKPSKRGRSNSGGGHTAIPYIRHRGENIYEKDN